MPNGYKINQHFPFQGSKIEPHWDFWYENKPSGNPVSGIGSKSHKISFSSLLTVYVHNLENL
jgi:hypothetical protein